MKLSTKLKKFQKKLYSKLLKARVTWCRTVVVLLSDCDSMIEYIDCHSITPKRDLY